MQTIPISTEFVWVGLVGKVGAPDQNLIDFTHLFLRFLVTALLKQNSKITTE